MRDRVARTNRAGETETGSPSQGGAALWSPPRLRFEVVGVRACMERAWEETKGVDSEAAGRHRFPQVIYRKIKMGSQGVLSGPKRPFSYVCVLMARIEQRR